MLKRALARFSKWWWFGCTPRFEMGTKQVWLHSTLDTRKIQMPRSGQNTSFRFFKPKPNLGVVSVKNGKQRCRFGVLQTLNVISSLPYRFNRCKDHISGAIKLRQLLENLFPQEQSRWLRQMQMCLKHRTNTTYVCFESDVRLYVDVYAVTFNCRIIRQFITNERKHYL